MFISEFFFDYEFGKVMYRLFNSTLNTDLLFSQIKEHESCCFFFRETKTLKEFINSHKRHVF